MPLFVVATALLNLLVGFVLAVYLGAAPKFANSRVPLLRDGHRRPPALVARLLAFLPRRRGPAPLP
jgi:hypothetical protein